MTSRGEEQVDGAAASPDLDRFRALLDYSSSAVILIHRESAAILEANDPACKLLGASRKRLLVTSAKEILTPGHWQRIAKLKAQRPSERPAKITASSHLLNPAGAKVPARLTFSLARSGETHYIVVVADRSGDRGSATADRRRSERIYQVLTKNMRSFNWSMDREFRINYISQSVKGILGFRVDEMIQRDLRDLVAPGSVQAATQAFERMKTVQKGSRHELDEVLTGELEMTCKGGATAWLDVSMAAFRSRAGIASGYLGFCRDISERKREEAERREMEARFQQTQRLESLGILAGGIAHDFNNLLTGIYGYSSLALGDLDEDSPARENIIALERIGHRAGDLTRQLLAYSGKGSFVIKSLSLNRVAQDMENLLKVSIFKKVAFETEMDEDLPEVEGDVAQIQQVVLNLVTNAADAIGHYAGTITLRTGTDRVEAGRFVDADLETDLPEGPYAYVEVCDTGCGMDAETQAKIFEPFFTTKVKGRGLGLSAVSGIVRGHKGAMKIHSTPGEGTAIKVLIPCKKRDARPASPSARGDSGPQKRWKGSGTILVVDDEDYVRDITQRILEEAGFTVVTATDGLEGIRHFAERPREFDAVLLDLNMPNMDGEEAFSELRKLRHDIPIVLTSGFQKEDLVNRLVKTDSEGFVQKPYRSTDLLDEFRQILEP